MTKKSFGRVLVEASIHTLIVIPISVIGLGIGGYLWSEKVEPWLNKKKVKKKTHEEIES